MVTPMVWCRLACINVFIYAAYGNDVIRRLACIATLLFSSTMVLIKVLLIGLLLFAFRPAGCRGP
jgi:hypothetical protein